MTTDRLEEIKLRHVGPFRFYQRVQPNDLTWLIEQIELQRTQLATLEARCGITPGMASEITDAHEALTAAGVPDDGKMLLAERIEMYGLKRCPKCKELKVLSKFAHNSVTTDGRQYMCRVCNAAYQKDHRVPRPIIEISEGQLRADLDEKLTNVEMAKKHGCSTTTITRRRAKYGLSGKGGRKNNIEQLSTLDVQRRSIAHLLS